MKNSEEETYRDIVSTVDEVGKRKWIYAHKPSGTLYNYRKYLSYVYLVLLVIVPFIKMNGNPLFLFDLVHGKFIVFGKLFLPQDFILFGLAMLTFLLFIIVFTLAYGRIFCGWVCPQTIFMEMVFRRIEYFIEGSASQQMRVNKGAWTTEILLKKILKHVIFFLVSFLIANIFLSYVIGVDALFQIISEPVKNHLAGFLAILLFSVVFYIVLFFSLSLIWVRATLPRYRYDQLMALGWKTILPTVISYFMFFACFLIFVDSFWLFDERSALLMLPVRVALETDTLLEPFWIPPETL